MCNGKINLVKLVACTYQQILATKDAGELYFQIHLLDRLAQSKRSLHPLGIHVLNKHHRRACASAVAQDPS